MSDSEVKMRELCSQIYLVMVDYPEDTHKGKLVRRRLKRLLKDFPTRSRSFKPATIEESLSKEEYNFTKPDNFPPVAPGGDKILESGIFKGEITVIKDEVTPIVEIKERVYPLMPSECIDAPDVVQLAEPTDKTIITTTGEVPLEDADYQRKQVPAELNPQQEEENYKRLRAVANTDKPKSWFSRLFNL